MPLNFVVIPVKKLLKSKSRLSSILSLEERVKLTLNMLQDVLEAIKSCSKVEETIVLGSDEEVEKVSKAFKARFMKDLEDELNKSINTATEICMEEGAKALLIIAADLPMLTAMDVDAILSKEADGPQVAIAPSRDGKGTNALLRTPPNIIPTRYGPNSFLKHLTEARLKNIPVETYRSIGVGLDVDSWEDVAELMRLKGETRTYSYLRKIEVLRKLRM